MIIVSAKTETERRRALRLAVSVLRQGGVIAYPTETVYGLGCDPRNTEALRRLFRIKGREEGKPVLVAAASLIQVKKMATISREVQSIVKSYWPGPLTVILPSLKRLMGRTDVAVRVSSDPFVQALCRAFRYPIVSTSANRSGESPARSASGVLRAFRGQNEAPDLVIDGGALPKRLASTIVRMESDGKIEIIRQGSIRV